MMDTTQGMLLTLEYDTDLYYANTISAMLAHFQTLLEEVTANPEQRVTETLLLADEMSSMAAERLALQTQDQAEEFNFQVKTARNP